MMTWFLSDTVRSVLERLYFLAGIVLAGSLIVAVWQARLQRKLSKITARREAYRIAAERCVFFGDQIAQCEIELKKALNASGSQILAHCKVEVGEKSITLNSKAMTDEDAEKANLHQDKLSKFANNIEGFAVFFVTGVADDNIGFLTCGREFVRIFEEWFPIWALSDSLEHHAKATQTLYARWKGRITQMELVRKHAEISQKLDPQKQKPAKPYGC